MIDPKRIKDQAAPATGRVGIQLVIGIAFAVVLAYWATDGFSKFPTWSDWAREKRMERLEPQLKGL